jgi:hypothetical protein
MSNTQEPQEWVPEILPSRREAEKVRCHQCNGRFGLIRHGFARKQFCTKACVDKYKTDTGRKISLIKEWRDYFARKV